MALDKKRNLWYSFFMKPRKLTFQLENAIEKPNKRIVFLWGPRQVGKSTILNHLLKEYGGSYFNFDNLEDQRLFTPELDKLESAINFKSGGKKAKMVFIDEIQKLPGSTQSIKLLSDITDYLIVATGSSELRANQFDTLAGRFLEFILFPLTLDEMAIFDDKGKDFVDRPDFAQSKFLANYLEPCMIYGSYPGVATSINKIEELKNITQNSVIKDIVNIYDLKNTDLVYNLLRLLSMQIGNLINVTELASSLGTTKITIDNYLSILAKNRIIYLLAPFKTNKRRAYTERKKVFFYDLGIRNALIDDFRPIDLRQDLGAVFENLIVMGNLRQIQYRKNNNKLFYYREIAGRQKEIDLIIETPQGERNAFEVKYSGGQVNKFPELGISNFEIISRENAAGFLV